MEGNRFRSVLAGVILGAILGWWIYFMPGLLLISGPMGGAFIPEEVRFAFFLKGLVFGVVPGVIVGFIAGLVLPFLLPRGHMAIGISTFCWIPITLLAWITQWGNVHQMPIGKVALTVLGTVFSFVTIVPTSRFLGEYIERIRE